MLVLLTTNLRNKLHLNKFNLKYMFSVTCRPSIVPYISLYFEHTDTPLVWVPCALNNFLTEFEIVPAALGGRLGEVCFAGCRLKN